MAYWIWTLAFSTAARSASTVALSAVGAGSRRVDLFPRGDAALGQILKALGLRRRVGGLREIALEVRLRLLQRGFERPPVQREQHLTLLDVVAFLERDRGELAGNLRRGPPRWNRLQRRR